jgi:hypothetical protein
LRSPAPPIEDDGHRRIAAQLPLQHLEELRLLAGDDDEVIGITAAAPAVQRLGDDGLDGAHDRAFGRIAHQPGQG